METDPRQVVQKWWDHVWGEGRLDLVDELLAPRFVRHDRRGTHVFTPQQYKKELAQFLRAIKGAQISVDDQVVDGQKVWSRLTGRGVNLEAQTPVSVTWIQIHRIEDGRIAEIWVMHQPELDWNMSPQPPP